MDLRPPDTIACHKPQDTGEEAECELDGVIGWAQTRETGSGKGVQCVEQIGVNFLKWQLRL
jgi:hypothetical protein